MSYSKNGFNKLQIGLSSGSHFTIDIYQSFYIGLIPLLTIKFDLTLFQVSLLGATSVLANSLFSPVFGYLSDRFGLKYFIAAGPLIAAVFLSLLGILPSYYLILLFLFIGNLSIAAFHPASAAIAGYYGGEKKALGSSLINFGGILGNSLGSLLIILIIEKIGIQYTPLAAIPGIITAFILLRKVPAPEATYTPQSNPGIIKKIKNVNKSKIYLLFLMLFTIYCLYIVWISIVNYMPLYFTQTGIKLTNIGVILFLFGSLGGIGGLISGYLFDRYKKGSFIMQFCLLAAIFLLFFIFRTSGAISIIPFIFTGFFLIPIQPVCIRMSQDLLPLNMGFASSLILGFAPGVAGITLIFLGKLADKVGIEALFNYELLFLALAFVLLFSFPITKRQIKS